ncbi:MAG: hypothetical protein ABEI52_08545, partial [Halobacteriaceae archaeon]
QNPNVAKAKRASVDNIPSSPSGWTDEGTIISDVLDIKGAISVDGTWHVVYKEDGSTKIYLQTGDSLTSLGGKTQVFDL